MDSGENEALSLGGGNFIVPIVAIIRRSDDIPTIEPLVCAIPSFCENDLDAGRICVRASRVR